MKRIFIAAGGTGGHINAALSMGEKFSNNYEVTYLSGTRYLDYQLFKEKRVIHLKSQALRSKNPLKILISLFKNSLVFLQILMMYILKRPKFVLGAGGYICGPTLLAAKFLFIPVFIIEQNAVMGVTNKILSKFSNLIFTNFKDTKGISNLEKVKTVGNPIRASIEYQKNKISDELNVLVFGGSLGANQINEVVQELIKEQVDYKLNIYHQVGKGNIKKVETTNPFITYKQVEYIDDMGEKYKWANIIIARAGASTISELRVIRKPVIFIPFPFATDNHQYFNAIALKEESDFYVQVLDHKLDKESLTKLVRAELSELSNNKEKYLHTKEAAIPNVAELIEKEITQYVRN